jgi:hypothetical protein
VKMTSWSPGLRSSVESQGRARSASLSPPCQPVGLLCSLVPLLPASLALPESGRQLLPKLVLWLWEMWCEKLAVYTY